MKYDVFGIGNPLIDVIVSADETVLETFNVQKGSMSLIGFDTATLVKQHLQYHAFKKSAGDSTANTLVGLSLLGNRVVYAGKAGNDADGALFEQDLRSYGVFPDLVRAEDMTGSCMSIITDDAQRTMLTYLGACLSLQQTDLVTGNLEQSRLLHLTGYQLEEPRLQATALYAMGIAKNHGKPVSVDLADAHLVRRNKSLLARVLTEFATIVFANKDEAVAYTDNENPADAAKILGTYAPIAVVKDGANGSYVAHQGFVVHVPAYRVAAVDTTGAGDMYAAGFLHAYLHGALLEKAARVGSYLAAEVVQLYGSRLPLERKEQLCRAVQQLLK
ncbi:adenosine kinase [Candidatus Woesearchaeota archaeon]|nr:adenosine kinase [Candidatus Woesearchaeota archaeon]